MTNDVRMTRRRRAVLEALADYPLGASAVDLAGDVQRGEPVERTVTRVRTVIAGLRNAGLVTRVGFRDRHLIYRLTQRGERFLELTDESSTESEATTA